MRFQWLAHGQLSSALHPAPLAQPMAGLEKIEFDAGGPLSAVQSR